MVVLDRKDESSILFVMLLSDKHNHTDFVCLVSIPYYYSYMFRLSRQPSLVHKTNISPSASVLPCT